MFVEIGRNFVRRTVHLALLQQIRAKELDFSRGHFRKDLPLCLFTAFLIPPDAVHGVKALEDGMLIDVFSPMRQEFV
ncbi:MAG: hypothetical protein EOM58_13450 [Clostridia bacterium]|nr:hypothetical protein [Clostridia bacterium]